VISQCQKTFTALVLALGAAVLLQTWRLHSAQLLLAETQAQHAQERAAQERLARELSETNRKQEQKYRERLTEVETQAQADLALARSAVGRARDAGERLQHELAAYVERQRGAASDSTAVGNSSAKLGNADLLAELFRRADARAGELAAAADEARIRGLACEAAYDAVQAPP